MAVSASGDNSFSGGIAKSAKSTLAFTVKGIVVGSQKVFADFATVGKAVDSVFSGVGIAIASGSHDNAGKKNNGLFQKM